jgi:hypothetical protein
MNGEQASETFERDAPKLLVKSNEQRDPDSGTVMMTTRLMSQPVCAEVLRLAQVGLEAERRSKEYEARCIAFVATVGRTIRDDKATVTLYNVDGEVKFLVETSGGLAFKGRAGDVLDALDDCITEGWCP